MTTCSLFPSCWPLERIFLALCASEGARGTCLLIDSAHLVIAAVPQCVLITRVQGATLSEYRGRPVCWFQSPCTPRREFFWWASICVTLMYPSNSHSDFLRAVAHMGIIQIGQISVALLPDHRAKAIGYYPSVSKKPKHRGFLLLFTFSITARQTVCNSAQQTDLFVSSLIRVVAIQIGCCPFTLELPSSSL